MGVDLIDIFNGFATWEQADLVSANITRADQFKAYATFPTPDDVDPSGQGPLKFPYSCHWCETSRWREVSVNSVDTVPGTGWVEDEEVHLIVACIMFGISTDEPHLLSERDAKWRNAYRDAFLKNLHLTLSILGNASSITPIMGDTSAISFDFCNADNVGIQTPITVTIRRKKQVRIT